LAGASAVGSAATATGSDAVTGRAGVSSTGTAEVVAVAGVEVARAVRARGEEVLRDEVDAMVAGPAEPADRCAKSFALGGTVAGMATPLPIHHRNQATSPLGNRQECGFFRSVRPVRRSVRKAGPQGL
jgi:hypothetical protein